ncbi:MAG TPA: S26 family signal peptidase [Rhizomicrobium sp.]
MSGDTVAGLSAGELEAVSQLWKRERRTLVTTFSGTSMMPAIAPGQEVAVECGVEPRIGDVAVFLRDDRIGVHRVVARCRDLLVTWGDANPLPDDPVDAAQVLGTISRVPPRPPSSYRTVLLAWLGASDPARLRRRLQLAYRLRGALAAGPAGFAAKAARALSRGSRR